MQPMIVFLLGFILGALIVYTITDIKNNNDNDNSKGGLN